MMQNIINIKKLNILKENKCIIITTLRNKNYFKSKLHSDIKIIITSNIVDFNLINKVYKNLSSVIDNYDYIFCIGSGRIIDLAKIIKFKLLEHNKKIKLCTIPSLLGSGAESSNSAVYYKNKSKQTISNSKCSSDFIYYDEMLYDFNSSAAKISMLDCFCQSIESIWSKKSNKISITKAYLSLDLSYKNLSEKRTNLFKNSAKASYSIGLAMNITRTTGPHALSYYLTIFNNIPHGQAVTILLIAFLKKHFIERSDNIKKDKELLILKALKIKKINELYFLLIKILIKYDLYKKVNLSNKEIQKSISFINSDRLANHPFKLNKKTIKEIYSEI